MSLSRFTADELLAARRVLTWAATTGRLRWQEFNWLMKSVLRHQRRLDGCRKENYPSFDIAKRIAARPHLDGARYAYHCAECGKVHIATVEPEKRRAAEAIKARKQEIERG